LVAMTGYGRNLGCQFEAVITKVGRKWISFKPVAGGMEDRFDAETRNIDGKQYSSPGKVYPSLAEYIEQSERGRLWTDFCQKMPFQAPDSISTDRIKELIAEFSPPRVDA